MNILLKAIKSRHIFKGFGITFGSFVVPAIFSLFASIFEGISIGVLLPVLKGIINMDFRFIAEISPFKFAVNYLPGITSLSNTTIFIILMSIIFFSAILKSVLQYLSTIIASYQVRKLTANIRNNLFKNYLSFGKAFFDRNNSGYLHNILMNYTSLLAEQIKGVRFTINALFVLIIYIVIMLIISWKLFIFACFLFFFLNYFRKIVIYRIKEISRLYEASLAKISKNISNILSCMPLVKLYTKEDDEYRHFVSLNRDIQKNEFNLDKKYNLIQPMQDVFFLIAVLLLIGAIAFMHVKEGIGELPGFLVFFFLLKRAQSSFAIISNFLASVAIIGAPVKTITKMLSNEDKHIIVDGKDNFCGLRTGIEFRHLNFSYPKGPLVLKDLSLLIEKGKITSIVGPTGAGKTSIVNLILRFYDCPPQAIMIDGKDIRDFSFSTLREHISLVSQDVLLLNDSIKSNIIYGLDDKVTDEQLFEVIKKARLDDFIATLKEGVNTYIGDRGVSLSGGERQRVSIARALLKDAEILILDEATSSLDTKTERLIQEAIDEVIRNRTVIVIAHRLSTIKNSDKIIFLDKGVIVEEGSLDDLLQKRGRFFEAWNEQKFH